MSERRHGSKTSFFDGTTVFDQTTNPHGGTSVPAGATSQPVQVGRGADNFSFYVQVTGNPAFTTTWLLQAAHSGSIDSQGVYPDPDTTTYVWHDCWYLGTSGSGNSTKVEITIPSGGGAVMSIVPDFVPGWVRLKRTDGNAAVTVIAGTEIQGD